MTPKLTVALSDIDEVTVDETVHLPPKKRSLLRFWLASALRSLLIRLTADDGSQVIDAEYKPADEHKNVYQIGAQRNGSDLERRSGETNERSA